jgi:transposase
MNLLDEQWQKLQPLLLGGYNDPGATGRDNRLFLQSVLWIVAHKAKWSDLPAEFGKWQTSYMRFRRWNHADVWRQLAGSVNDDKELRTMLDAIVAFGDEHTQRAKRRLTMRNNKIAYNSALASDRQPQSGASWATGMPPGGSQNWVWLVSGK